METAVQLWIFSVCVEDERLNDSSEYMLNFDSSGKNCKWLLRLDASDLRRLLVKTIFETLLF